MLPPPALTILLDIAPETAVQRKAAGRDRYERDLELLSRVRHSYRAAGRRRRLAAPRRRAVEGQTSAPTSSGRSRHDSRGGNRPHVLGARLPQHLRARLQRRARRAHVVDEHDTQPVRRRARQREAERAADVGVAPRGRQIRLRRCRADSLAAPASPGRRPTWRDPPPD